MTDRDRNDRPTVWPVHVDPAVRAFNRHRARLAFVGRWRQERPAR